MRGRRNAYGNAIYGPEDKRIAEKLNALDVDEVWAAQHIERCTAEIRATWTTSETGRRDQHSIEGVCTQEVPRIDFNVKGMRLA